MLPHATNCTIQETLYFEAPRSAIASASVPKMKHFQSYCFKYMFWDAKEKGPIFSGPECGEWLDVLEDNHEQNPQRIES